MPLAPLRLHVPCLGDSHTVYAAEGYAEDAEVRGVRVTWHYVQLAGSAFGHGMRYLHHTKSGVYGRMVRRRGRFRPTLPTTLTTSPQRGMCAPYHLREPTSRLAQ